MAVQHVRLLLADRAGCVLFFLTIEAAWLHPSLNSGWRLAFRGLLAAPIWWRGKRLERIGVAPRGAGCCANRSLSTDCVYCYRTPAARWAANAVRAGGCIRALRRYRADAGQPVTAAHAALRDSDPGDSVSGGSAEVGSNIDRSKAVGPSVGDRNCQC